ncbi:hypothetical protein [Paracoccus sp. SSK6]|uniref:hypothetical protein n=1 Tax=Paracoccus sp. SSK6 TaxID=3143131 RepID=UPI00321B2199
MIPAATIPQVPQTPCTLEKACWIPGTGFRVIDDTGATCALIDTPMEGKAAFYARTDEHHPLRSLFINWKSVGAAEAGTLHITAADSPAPAPVPLPGAGGMLGAALITAALIAALLKFVAADEAVRGLDSGRP